MPKIIDDALFEETMKYLASRPYGEVAGGMNKLAQSSDLASQDQATAQQRDAAYAMLDSCILTGQVPDEEVPKMLQNNPDFATWRQSKR